MGGALSVRPRHPLPSDFQPSKIRRSTLITITEALADLKTIDKRIEKKREFVLQFIARLSLNRDPLEKEGGVVEAVRAERQAIQDLQDRTILIRRAIQKANDATQITIDGESRSIADWLIWRREVAPRQQQMLQQMRDSINRIRQDAKKRDARIVESAAESQDNKDVIIHISETQLAKDIERMELILGTLDGQLSLKNATVTVDV